MNDLLPSEKQLEYAEAISEMVEIPYNESDREECSKFIFAYAEIAKLKKHCSLPTDTVKWLVDNLDGKSGLYAFISDGEVVYIGKSINLAQRICTSYNERCWSFNYPIDEIRYCKIPNETDLNILELIMIAKYKPVMNRDCNADEESTLRLTDLCVWDDFQEVPLWEMGAIIKNKWWSDEKEVRKLLGLPSTKTLVYYANKFNNDVQTIKQFKIVGIYNPSKTYSLLIELEDGKQIRIMCNFLVEMQSPSFIKNIEKLRQKED